jgi:hypothetical protein
LTIAANFAGFYFVSQANALADSGITGLKAVMD